MPVGTFSTSSLLTLWSRPVTWTLAPLVRAEPCWLGGASRCLVDGGGLVIIA